MSMNWGLTDWLAFQETSHAQVIDMGLTRVRLVASRLSLTSSTPFTITVAGTNGKGSSTAMLSRIYTAAGYKVGWYSSPHLLNYNERIRINNMSVSDGLLVDAFRAIAAVSQDMTLSYFEWGTLAALWVFKQQGCDIQVLEVGLGGRLDAVNVIDADAVLITPIDIDHQAYLGDTREVIAVEKAGVFRAGQVAVCSDPNPPNALIDAAQTLGLSLFLSGCDFSWQVQAEKWVWRSSNRAYLLPKPALRGHFQYANAAGVVMLVHALCERLLITQSAITQGLATVQLSGRMTMYRLNEQDWLVDVAHNTQSISALAQYLASHAEPVIAVFSALSDKDIANMVTILAPSVSHWYVAPLGGARGASLIQLQQAFSSIRVPIDWFDTLAQACAGAKDMTSTQMRLICGSFVTVEKGLDWLESYQCNTD